MRKIIYSQWEFPWLCIHPQSEHREVSFLCWSCNLSFPFLPVADVVEKHLFEMLHDLLDLGKVVTTYHFCFLAFLAHSCSSKMCWEKCKFSFLYCEIFEWHFQRNWNLIYIVSSYRGRLNFLICQAIFGLSNLSSPQRDTLDMSLLKGSSVTWVAGKHSYFSNLYIHFDTVLFHGYRVKL